MAGVTDCNMQVANKVNANDLGRAGEEGLGEDWEVLGGRGSYGSDLKEKC
jgi:hypothetical protein